MPPFFTLRQVVSQTRARPADVLNVKRALNRMGFSDVPDYGMTPYPDGAMFEGIQRFQRANGLRVDGVMQRGHATERAMNDRLQQLTGAGARAEGDRNRGRKSPQEDHEEWRNGEIIRIGKQIQSIRANLARKWDDLRRERDPIQRQAIRASIRQLERQLDDLQRELERVKNSRWA